jgi:GNAT superfamily N-acetyltransferase
MNLSQIFHSGATTRIQEVRYPEDLQKCLEVIYTLRPQLTGKNLWPLFRQMQKENYHIIFIEEQGVAIAFAGYRLMHLFHSGRTLYIDDLCTLPAARNKGHAGRLLDYLIRQATLTQSDRVSLDSGHFRHAAHRLYLKKGFNISSHHFELKLNHE